MAIPSASSRLKLLIAIDWFFPGYKAGGPIRSCVNLVHALAESLEVKVICGDRDLGDAHAYPGVPTETWTPFGQHALVAYLPPAARNWLKIRQWIRLSGAHILYLNSMFSVPFALVPLLLKRWGLIEPRIILAPRGMLHKGAMQFKSAKKRLALAIIKGLGAHKGVCFQATDAQEENDIRAQFGKGCEVAQLPNFPPAAQPPFQSLPKSPGSLRMVFISRIHPKKHLKFLLELMMQAKGRIELDIYGPVDDPAYWSDCQKLMHALPAHLQAAYRGELPHPQVWEALQASHLFVLPTQGENFGHAILEALLAGRPVLISDQTPWRQLSASKVGFDLPLQAPEAFQAAINDLLHMDQAAFDRMAKAAWDYGHAHIDNPELKDAYLSLFHHQRRRKQP